MSESARDEATLRKILRTRTDAFEALKGGIGLAMRSGGLALGAAVGLGVALGLGEYATAMAALEVKSWSDGTLGTLWQLGAAVSLFLGIYFIIQLAKRSTASVESWLPALFALPVLSLTGGFAFAKGSMPITDMLFFNAFSIVFAMVVSTPVLILWIRAGQAAAEDREHDLGETLLAMREQYRQVMVVRGAKFQAILVGIQVVLPGIFYALQLAFAEIIAVLQPERSALRRSGQLTWGMRGRIFRLLALCMVPSNLIVLGVLILLGSATTDQPFAEYVSFVLNSWLMNPAGLGLVNLIVQDTFLMVVWWVTILSVLVLFNEREAQVAAKRELKRIVEAKQASDDEGPAEAAESADTPA